MKIKDFCKIIGLTLTLAAGVTIVSALIIWLIVAITQSTNENEQNLSSRWQNEKCAQFLKTLNNILLNNTGTWESQREVLLSPLQDCVLSNETSLADEKTVKKRSLSIAPNVLLMSGLSNSLILSNSLSLSTSSFSSSRSFSKSRSFSRSRSFSSSRSLSRSSLSSSRSSIGRSSGRFG